MKRIPLTQGKFALVDDIDYDYLSQFKWHFHQKYAARGCSPKIRMHRVIAERAGIDCSQTIDHINLKRNNNRRRNLRAASNAQQAMNCNKNSSNTSGYKGVSWHKQSCKWQVRIQGHHLNLFTDKLDAARAYNKVAKKLFGKFARLNEIGGDLESTG